MNLFHNASFLAVTQTVVLLMLINSKTALSAPKERLRLFHPYGNTYHQMARIYPTHKVKSFAGNPNVLVEPISYYEDLADSYFSPPGSETQRDERADDPSAPAPPITRAFWNKRNVLKKLALQGARGFGK